MAYMYLDERISDKRFYTAWEILGAFDIWDKDTAAEMQKEFVNAYDEFLPLHALKTYNLEGIRVFPHKRAIEAALNHVRKLVNQ